MIFHNNNGDIMQNFIIDAKKSLNVKKVNKHGLNVKSLDSQKGRHLVLEYNEECMQREAKLITNVLSKTLKKFLIGKDLTKVLIVGLGNPKIPADTLGIKVTEKLIATNQYNFLTIPKVILVNPNVLANTGLKSYDLINMIIKKEKPTTIIIIDSMSTTSQNNLYYSIEINDCGIIPASVLGLNRQIKEKTYKVPIIFMGIPLIYKIKEKYYTDINLNEILNISSDIISGAIDKTLIRQGF